MSFDIEQPQGLWRPGATQERAAGMTFVAPGTETRGEFGLFAGTLSPGQGVVPHRHDGFSESFYLLSGELRLRVGDETRTAGPGDFVYVPPRGVHVFRNDGDADVRFVMIFAPGAPREAYFRDMAALAARDVPPTDDEIDEVAGRHDQTNLRDARWALP